MGIFDIRKKLQELKEIEQGETFEIQQQVDPKEYTILERGAHNVASVIAPQATAWEEDYFKVGHTFTRTLYISGFPPQVNDNWLAQALRFAEAIDVSIYIQPLPIRPFLHKLRQQIAHDHAAIQQQLDAGRVPNAKRTQRLEDAQQFVAAVEQDVTKPFQTKVVMTVRAKTLDELNRMTEHLENSLTGMNTREAQHRHKQGFVTTMPLMDDELADMAVVRLIQTHGLMAMFPFTSANITHESGVLVGVDQISRTPIILNRFMQPVIEAPHTAILGATGSGKSFFAKLEMLRWCYHGVPVIVLDPSGEYERVCDGVGGANINISLDSDQVINPLDFSNAVRPRHNALREKIAFMIELVKVMLKDEGQSVNIDPVTRQIFENALQETYRRYGYLVDSIDSQLRATREQMPTLSEVVVYLQRIARTNRDPQVQERVRPLLAALQVFVGDGHLAPLFDRRTSVDIRSHFVNFNYQGLARQYLPMAMHLVLEFLRTTYFTREQTESGTHRLLYVDEAQELMRYTQTAHFLEFVARQARKYGIGLTVLTQNVGVWVLNEDGSENKVGTGILNACPIKVLLKQQPNESKALLKAFDLTEGELTRLLASRSGEGLVIVGDETGWFSAVGMACPEEHEMLTTNMSERAQIARMQQAGELPPVDQGRFLSGGAARDQLGGDRDLPGLPPAGDSSFGELEDDPFGG